MKCPICNQEAKNKKEEDFIMEIGRCYSCDKIQLEIIS